MGHLRKARLPLLVLVLLVGLVITGSAFAAQPVVAETSAVQFTVSSSYWDGGGSCGGYHEQFKQDYTAPIAESPVTQW